MRYAVIMAGGAGTRLWPLSRRGMPKQLLPLLGDKSLLRISFDRIRTCVPVENIFVCTGAAYAAEVQAELPELLPERLLGEPVGRDSLNAVAWPAAVIHDEDPDAIIATVTADHVIEPVVKFAEAMNTAFAVAEQHPDALVTFGVVPDHPAVGFGYLKQGKALPGFDVGVCEVAEFKEKPDAVTAEEYLASGQFWWNSGMFVWRADTLLAQLEQLLPDTHAAVLRLAQKPDLINDIYPTLEKTSVDYGVMEPVSRGQGTAKVVGVSLDIDWADVGSFAALAGQLEADASGVIAQGDTVQVESSDSLLINRAEGRALAVMGVSDLVIVQTDDITLVCPKEYSDRVKELVAAVAEQHGERYA